MIRSLVSAIELVPEGGELAIVLRGDLAAMLSFAADKQKPGALSREAGLMQGSLVAGTRNQRWLRCDTPQKSLFPPARTARFLPLIEQPVPRIAA